MARRLSNWFRIDAMKRGIPMVCRMTAPLLSVLILIAGAASAYAQSDVDGIKAAITALHAAISSLDNAKMDPLWAHDDNVMLINPRDKKISVGWGAVQQNWQRTFSVWSQLSVTQAEGPFVRVDGNIGWSTGIANAVGKTKSGATVNAPTIETDVWQKNGATWLLVSHTASRVPQ
jgi:ketosteroid isomerase-like protein